MAVAKGSDMSRAQVIEDHVRQLIRDESRSALSEAIAPVVREAATVAAVETTRRIAEQERRAAELLFTPLSSSNAAHVTIDMATRASHEKREQFIFYSQDVRRHCLSLAESQIGVGAAAEELIDRAAKLEHYILWGDAK